MAPDSKPRSNGFFFDLLPSSFATSLTLSLFGTRSFSLRPANSCSRPPSLTHTPFRQKKRNGKKKKKSSPRSPSSASASTPSSPCSWASRRSGTSRRPTRGCRRTSPRRAGIWRGAGWWMSWPAIECVKVGKKGGRERERERERNDNERDSSTEFFFHVIFFIFCKTNPVALKKKKKNREMLRGSIVQCASA